MRAWILQVVRDCRSPRSWRRGAGAWGWGPRAAMIVRVDSFVPRPSLVSGHKMTLFGWGNPRYFPRLPAPTVRYFDVAADARVLAHCHWQAQPWANGTLLLLHGLNASSDAHYMK